MARPTSHKVTIKDIARELGVAPSTVTRALAGSPRISAETASRVRRQAEAMGYVVDATARAMQRGTSALVGLLVPDIQNHFYATMAHRIAEQCRRHDHQLVLAVSEDDPGLESEHVRALVGARCAGVLITPSPRMTPSTCRLLADVPTVQLIRHHTGLDADGFGIDDSQAIHTATRYLLDLGHERIGLLCGNERLDTALARRDGYATAMHEQGLAPDPDLIEICEPRAEQGRTAALRLLSKPNPPSAVIAAGAALTEGLLDAISGLAAEAPPSLLGFGDQAALRWWQGGGLTTIDLPLDAVADAASERLFEQIASGVTATDGPSFERFEARIILRGSTRRHAPYRG